MLGPRLRSLWRSLSRRADVERQMSDELLFHIEARADDLMARHGLSRADAIRRARIEFGSLEKYKEEARQSLGVRLIDEPRADLRYALRTFGRTRGFTAAAIATLAIGIGANAAVFSVVDAVLIRTLPVRDPHELVLFQWLRTNEAMVAGYSGYGRPGPRPGVGIRTSFSLLTYERFRDHSRTLESVFAFARLGDVSVAAGGPAGTATAQVVTGEFFSTLGVSAAAGRTLQESDDGPGSDPVMVVSHRYWQRSLNGDPAVVGRTIRINRMPVTVVGVTQEGFEGTHIGRTVDVIMPMALADDVSGDAGRPLSTWWVELMGRLAPGATRAQAASELEALFRETVLESWAMRPPDTPNPSRNGVPELQVVDGSQGSEQTRRDAAPLLAILFTVVAAVLLIACVNVANLLLVRASARSHEMALRLVLGAGRARVMRQLFTESVLLALCGGAAGLILARWMKDFTASIVLDAPEQIGVIGAGIDPRVIAFTAVLSLGTAIAFGVGPALRATRGDLSVARRLDRQKSRGARGTARKVLVAVQVALCLTLLVSAGLLLRTLRNFSAVDVGFDADNLLVFRMAGRTMHVYEDLIARIEALPGVQSATLSAMPLVANYQWTETVIADGDSRPADVYVQSVRSNFFDTLGVPLLSGRGLTPADTEDAPGVAVINETMARQIFASPNPIGRHFRLVEGPERDRPIQVVGIVGDTKYSRLPGAMPPTFYVPYTQRRPAPMFFEVRTLVDPLTLVPAVRSAARDVDANLPLMELRTQRQQIARTFRDERSMAVVTSIFSAIALLLASIGLYGIVAYDVRRRTSEIGVRMALGARRADVLRVVLRETLGTVAAGALVGLGLAAVTSRLVERMLFGVAPTDPLTIAGAVLMLVVVAAVAAYIPARAAIRLDPVQALRHE